MDGHFAMTSLSSVGRLVVGWWWWWGGWALCDDFRLIIASGFRAEAKGEERTERAPWLEDALLSILKRPE